MDKIDELLGDYDQTCLRQILQGHRENWLQTFGPIDWHEGANEPDQGIAPQKQTLLDDPSGTVSWLREMFDEQDDLLRIIGRLLKAHGIDYNTDKWAHSEQA